MSFILVKSFDNAIDAHLFKIELENEGIECFIFDEEIVTINPLYSNAVGGIKVKVRSSDIDKVKQYYTNNQPSLSQKCPNCQSSNTIIDTTLKTGMPKWIAVFLGFLSGTFPFAGKTDYRCLDCNHLFK